MSVSCVCVIELSVCVSVLVYACVNVCVSVCECEYVSLCVCECVKRDWKYRCLIIAFCPGCSNRLVCCEKLDIEL